MDKKKSQERHAKKRILERTGFYGGVDKMQEWVSLIQSGKAEFIDRQSNRITRWFVIYGGKRLAVVYDKKRKQIVTVLTEDMIKPPTEKE